MAEKRMFSMKIIDSDAFLDMPMSSQALYFHLNMRADDDGFINNPKRILRMVGSTEDDLRLLITKKFVLAFESGVIVVKHWRIHNYIRKDRKKDTTYLDEASQIYIKSNGAYTLDMTDKCLTSDCQVTDMCLTSDCIDKNRLDKNRIDKNRTGMPDDVRQKIQEVFKEV